MAAYQIIKRDAFASEESSSLSSTMEAAREHVNEMRRTFFSAGSLETSPGAKKVFLAAEKLSDEISRRRAPPNFIEELIRNADENVYPADVEPFLEFILVQGDVTGFGASHTLLVFSNEVGFSKEDVETICNVRKSSKKERKPKGSFPERGTGFKSVFHYCERPYIFSNGYQFTFEGNPDHNCLIRIIPKWVDSEQIIRAISEVYGVLPNSLPTSVFALPLRPKKVERVRSLLSLVQRECLLFSAKLKHIALRFARSSSEEELSRLFKYLQNAIIICKEELPLRSGDNNKGVCHGEASTVLLTVRCMRGGQSKRVRAIRQEYFMLKEKFPMEDFEKEEEVVIAFPQGVRVAEMTQPPCIFSSFPMTASARYTLGFLIQSNFLLTPEDEIDPTNEWNMRLLSFISEAFIHAFISYLDNVVEEEAFIEAFEKVLEFLPVNYLIRSKRIDSSSNQTPQANRTSQTVSSMCLQHKRNKGEVSIVESLSETIRVKFRDWPIIPCTNFSGNDHFFEKPTNVRRILPSFRYFMNQMIRRNVCLTALRNSSMKCVLHPGLDNSRISAEVFDYLGVEAADSGIDWYGECIENCNLLGQLDSFGYVELLFAIADNWSTLRSGNISDIPILKYVAKDGNEELCSLSSCREMEMKKICYSMDLKEHEFMRLWTTKLSCPMYFLPLDTHYHFLSHRSKYYLLAWLELEVQVFATSVRELGSFLARFFEKERAKLIEIAQLPCFLHESTINRFISETQAYEMCCQMPVVDSRGQVLLDRAKTLVPASGSNWAQLFGPINIYAEEKYVNLSDVYNGVAGSQYLQAVDLPELYPPEMELEVASSALEADRAILLLEWLRFLRLRAVELPRRFIESIRGGGWIKVTAGFRPPIQCFLYIVEKRDGPAVLCEEEGLVPVHVANASTQCTTITRLVCLWRS